MLAVYESIRRFRTVVVVAVWDPRGRQAGLGRETWIRVPRLHEGQRRFVSFGENAVTNEPEDKRANEHGVSRN